MENQRLNHLYDLLKANGLAALALNPGPTLTYLTGLNFHLMERPVVLLVSPTASPVIILPELETGKLRNSQIQLKSFAYSDNPVTWQNAFTQALQSLHLEQKNVGVEPARMRVLELRFLETAIPGAHFVSAETPLSELRLCKEIEEINSMRTAARIAQDGLQAALPMIKPGVSERDICAELLIQLFRAGSDADLPFNPTVASGPNSADPHAGVSERKLEKGDFLLIDWGASYKGYFSDLTRTFAIGELNPEMGRIYELVREANGAGRAAGRPGISAGEVDHAARKVIDTGGYGEYFIHRTGHGLGMEVHEPPYIYLENKQLLKEGMVYTIEPGIYLNGRVGVRIEDDVVITERGCESLTDFPREMQVLE